MNRISWVLGWCLLCQCLPSSARADEGATPGLPFAYFIVGKAGARGQSNIATVRRADTGVEYKAGYAFAASEERSTAIGSAVRSRRGLWFDRGALERVQAISFHGEDVRGGALDFGWVVEDGAPVRALPDGGARILQSKSVFDRVPIPRVSNSHVRNSHAGWTPVGVDRWMRTPQLRIPSGIAPPPGIGPQERWIDIDLGSQTLVAYEGATPVFATLVSTGIGRPGSPLATPIGLHRVTGKARSSDMDNLEHTGVSYYSIEDVPWVQSFARGAALHGAFWHRRFGHPHSHGCVNLAPLDAERLYSFTIEGTPINVR